MKLLHLAVFSLLICLPISSFAGKKAKVTEGSLTQLKGVKKMNIQFQYEGLTIGKAEIPNEEYVNNRKEELNKKESGKGTTWARAWENDRTRRFEPGFRDYFNRAESGIRVGAFPEEKYTMIFKTTNLEPGYNVGVSRKNALVSGEAWIVETANPTNVICKIQVKNAPGNMGGFDFDNGERIRMAYGYAGNLIGKLVKKNI
jgi:hypothetical protein